MAEWLKATDCKSVPARVRWFESTSAQFKKTFEKSGVFFVILSKLGRESPNHNKNQRFLRWFFLHLLILSAFLSRRTVTQNVTFSHILLNANGVLTSAHHFNSRCENICYFLLIEVDSNCVLPSIKNNT